MRDLCETADPASAARAAPGERLGSLDDILANTPSDRRDPRRPWLLAPIDLQAIKAAGVTFADFDDRAGDRGTRARRARRRRGDPRRHRPLRRRRPGDDQAWLAGGGTAEAGADRRGRCGRNISRSASARTPRSSPRANRCRRSAPAPTPASSPPRSGTIPSPRSCSRSIRRARSSARRSATTSTCAISRAARRCCSARPRTRTRAARSARSCGCSTQPSRSTTCAAPRWP